MDHTARILPLKILIWITRGLQSLNLLCWKKGADYVKVQVHEDSLYELQDTNNDQQYDNIRWVGEKTLADDSARYWSRQRHFNGRSMILSMRPLRRIGMYGYGSSITDLGDNVLQFSFPGGSSYREGCTYQVRDGVRNQVVNLYPQKQKCDPGGLRLPLHGTVWESWDSIRKI